MTDNEGIDRVVRHLRPLGIAANIIQAAFCRLDSVALTFAYLIWTYSQMNDLEDIPGRNAIINSVEKRWAKTDQDVFIAAVLLNPFYRFEPFGTNLNNADALRVIIKLWQRFHNTVEPPPNEFLEQLSNYLTLSGDFESLKLTCQMEKLRADKDVSL